jgi:hypothetical protein
MSDKWKCKTCNGEGIVRLDCKDPSNCLGGVHELECPCCEGEGSFDI